MRYNELVSHASLIMIHDSVPFHIIQYSVELELLFGVQEKCDKR